MWRCSACLGEGYWIWAETPFQLHMCSLYGLDIPSRAHMHPLACVAVRIRHRQAWDCHPAQSDFTDLHGFPTTLTQKNKGHKKEKALSELTSQHIKGGAQGPPRVFPLLGRGRHQAAGAQGTQEANTFRTLSRLILPGSPGQGCGSREQSGHPSGSKAKVPSKSQPGLSE